MRETIHRKKEETVNAERQTLANKVFEASTRQAYAWYRNDKAEFDRWGKIYANLTAGMYVYQADKLGSSAETEYKQGLLTTIKREDLIYNTNKG